MTRPTVRTAHGNRFGLALAGFVLLAAGGYVLARSLGAFGRQQADAPVYADGTADWVHQQRPWLWITIAALAVLGGIWMIRWLLVQLRSDSLRRVALDRTAPANPGQVGPTCRRRPLPPRSVGRSTTTPGSVPSHRAHRPPRRARVATAGDDRGRRRPGEGPPEDHRRCADECPDRAGRRAPPHPTPARRRAPAEATPQRDLTRHKTCRAGRAGADHQPRWANRSTGPAPPTPRRNP